MARRCSVLLVAFLLLMLFPPAAHAQVPAAAVDLSCEGDRTSWNGTVPVLHLSCEVINPTSMDERIELDASAVAGLDTTSMHQVVTVGPGNSTLVEAEMPITNRSLAMVFPHLSIEAVVIEANGLPPASTATATAMVNATGLNRTCNAPASSASAWGSVLQMHVAYQSTVGIIEIELNDSEAPRAAENFRMLAHMGCYDGVTFHRVIDGFVLQGGDIECGREGSDCSAGTGGHAAMFHGLCDGVANVTGCTDPSQQTLPEESSADLTHVPFALSMANAGMNTGGSQFFIVDNGSNPTHLDHTPGKDCRNASCHTIFGHVVGGMMHVDAISQVPTISPYSTPVDAVLILGFTAMTMDSVEAEQPVDLAAAFTDLRLEQVLRQSNATIATMNFTLNNSGAWVGNVSYAATYGGQALTDVDGHLLVDTSGIFAGGMEVDITDLEVGSNLCFSFTYADGLDPSGWDAWDRPSQTCLTLSDVGVDPGANGTESDIGTPSEVVPGFGMGAALIGLSLAGLGRRSSSRSENEII